MAITRSTPGTKLIARNEWDSASFAFNVSDWTAAGVNRPQVSVSSSKLQLRVVAGILNGVRCFVRRDVADNYSRMMVYVRYEANHGFPNVDHQVQAVVAAGISDVTGGSEDLVRTNATVQRALGEVMGLGQVVAGTDSALATSAAVAAKTYGTEYGLTLFNDVSEDETVAYDFNSDVTVSGTAGVGHTGKPGVGVLVGHIHGGDGWVNITRFFACVDRITTVTGLPAGSTVEVRTAADVVLATAAESSGVAEVDMLKVRLEQAVKLVVLDGSSAVLATYQNAGEIIEPGETYLFGPDVSAPVVLAPTTNESIENSNAPDPRLSPYLVQWTLDGEPAVVFGYATDLHSADRDTVINRYYRDAVEKLQAAVSLWNSLSLDFVLFGGDFIDHVGLTKVQALADLAEIEAVYGAVTAPRYYVLGNHDLDQLSKDEFIANTGMSEAYYSFIVKGITFVVLDACYSADDDDAHYDSGNFVYTDTFIPPAERAWLEDLLSNPGPVVIFCHQRLDSTANPLHLINNASAVRGILEGATASILAVFHGHSHENADHVENGIRYITMQAMVESEFPANAYAVIGAFTDADPEVHGIDQQDMYTTVGEETFIDGEYRAEGEEEWIPITGFSDIQEPASFPWDFDGLDLGDYELRVGRATASSPDPVWSDPQPFSLVLSPIDVAAPARKAWAFTLDGHIFYVLGSFGGMTLLYDLVTGQWCRWSTGNRLFWNMHRGVMWRGRVLAADVQRPIIWELDPSTLLDEGAIEIARVVTGFQPVRGDQSIRQGSLRMVARQQTGAPVNAQITLRFSDDGGRTWSSDRTLDLANATERLEFRSLGRIRKPGRIWEIEDSGGLIRIDGVEANLEGSDG